jgi:hypothetical protein
VWEGRIDSTGSRHGARAASLKHGNKASMDSSEQLHKIYNAILSDQRTLPILLSLPQTCFPVSFKILTRILNKTSKVHRTQHGKFVQPLLPWKSSIIYFWVCICSLSYPACKVHASYYFVKCGLSGCIIFFAHYLIKGTIFRKTLLNINCVCSLQLLSQTFLNVTIEWDTINFHRHPCKVPRHSYQILIKLQFSSFSKNTQT